jgi:hypothetical protein
MTSLVNLNLYEPSALQTATIYWNDLAPPLIRGGKIRMSRFPRVLLGTLGWLTLVTCVSTAPAQISAAWRQNSITPQAIVADPALANMQSWSLMGTMSGNWADTGLEIILPAGNAFYNPTNGGNTRPAGSVVLNHANVEFDTYVTSPLDAGGGIGAPLILGQANLSPGQAIFGEFTPRFTVRWGNLTPDPPGTFELARLTFPAHVPIPYPVHAVYSLVQQSQPDASSFIPSVGLPEPSVILLLPAAAAALRWPRQLGRAWARRS